MSAFDPLPHFIAARQQREARSAQLLETLSGMQPPTYLPWTQEDAEQLRAQEMEVEEWQQDEI